MGLKEISCRTLNYIIHINATTRIRYIELFIPIRSGLSLETNLSGFAKKLLISGVVTGYAKFMLE